MKAKPLKLAAGLFVTLTSTLTAQVTVNGTGSVIGNSTATNPGSTTYTYTLKAPATTKVIVAGYYNDNTAAVTGMTFGGQPATRFITQTRTAIGSYAFTGTAPATISITANLNGAGAPTAGFFIYELANVDTSGGATAIDAGTGATIVTTKPDKFIVNFKGYNNNTGAGVVPAAGSIIAAANSAVFDVNGGIGGGALLRGYGTAAGPAGTKTLGWTAGDAGEVSLAFLQAGNPDSDGDGITDSWELSWAPKITSLTQLNGTITTPTGSGDGSGDWDGDGYSDLAEFNGGVNSSDPTNPASVPGDVDGDGWADSAEIAAFGNLSQKPGGDFDGDYSTNKVEVDAGKSPTSAASWPDTDNDGMADGWETANGLNVGVNDAEEDPDADGYTNLQEFLAGSDPHNAAWTPTKAVLANRWSFTGNLTDSIGTSNALVMNTDTVNVGLTSAQDPTDFTLNGGAKATSDYLKLGNNLLSSLQTPGVKPITIELWATQNAIQNWSRIFDFGKDNGVNPTTNESLRMTWTQGTTLNSDQVGWEPVAAGAPGNSPYVLGIPYHVVMTIVPAVFSNGAITSGARVTWYSAPASGSRPEGHPLYAFKGSFNSTSDLRFLVDSACTLGRSMYGDNTASATYDEVRIWKGALTDIERKLFQLLGPDNIDRSDVDNGGLGDGFPDQWELVRFGNTTTATVGVDTDGDGETDDVEFTNESDPNNILSTSIDSDHDNLADVWEMTNFKNLLQSGTDDPDMDGSNNELEETYGTNPNLASSSPDTDGDGISDGWEIANFGDLTTADSTLRPGGTNTNYDGDFDTDLQEFQGSFDPKNRFSGRDTDLDQLPDYWEYVYFQPIFGASYLVLNGTNDYDLDKATNADEFKDGTDPTNATDFKDVNADGFYDGILLAATDGFGATSFNAGTNWPGALAPVAGKNYLVTNGFTLRTPNVANQTTVFAGSLLAFGPSQLLLKGTNSIVQANYVFDGVTVRNGEDVGQPVTVAGTVVTVDPSTLSAENGTIIMSAKVSGSGDLTLNGNATVIQQVQFTNATNTWTGNLTLNPTASLIVNGTLSPGTASVYILRPKATGVTNSIGGTGTFTLAGTLNLDLSAVVRSSGASWNLVTIVPTYNSGFTVADSAALVGGFTAGAGAAGTRTWTSGNGDYNFSESTGVLSFVGTVPGYVTWASTAGLTVGVNDGAKDNPDADGFSNILEYQLGGNPLAFDRNLVIATADATNLIFTFSRSNASETDSTLNFRWGNTLTTWNTVPVGATSSGPDVNGVTITVTPNGGLTTDYDLIEIRLPKTNAVGGKLFGQLQGTQP